MTSEERDRLGVIEAKIDTILVKMEYAESTAKDHESRLRGLEKWKYAVPASVVTAIALAVAQVVVR